MRCQAGLCFLCGRKRGLSILFLDTVMGLSGHSFYDFPTSYLFKSPLLRRLLIHPSCILHSLTLSLLSSPGHHKRRCTGRDRSFTNDWNLTILVMGASGALNRHFASTKSTKKVPTQLRQIPHLPSTSSLTTSPPPESTPSPRGGCVLSDPLLPALLPLACRRRPLPSLPPSFSTPGSNVLTALLPHSSSPRRVTEGRRANKSLCRHNAWASYAREEWRGGEEEGMQAMQKWSEERRRRRRAFHMQHSHLGPRAKGEPAFLGSPPREEGYVTFFRKNKKRARGGGGVGQKLTSLFPPLLLPFPLSIPRGNRKKLAFGWKEGGGGL